MKGLDTGKEKVKKICDILRRETLEPAELQVKQILQQAHAQADAIIKSAKLEAEKLKEEAFKDIEKEKNILTTSLQQAGKQMLDSLKESIEKKLFNPELSSLLSRPLQDSKVIAALIQAVIGALEKEGTSADLDVIIPKSVSPQAVNECLMQNILYKLKNNSVSVGPIAGGAEIKVVQNNISIDVTEAALQEWLSSYLRQEFRKTLFEAS